MAKRRGEEDEEPTYQEGSPRLFKTTGTGRRYRANAIASAIRRMLVDDVTEREAREDLNRDLERLGEKRLLKAEFAKIRREIANLTRLKVWERKEREDWDGERYKARDQMGRAPLNPEAPLTRRVSVRISEDDLDHVKSLLKKARTNLKKTQKERKAEDEKLELPKLGEIKPPWVFRALLWWTRTSEGKKALPRIFKGYADHVLSARAEALTRPDES